MRFSKEVNSNMKKYVDMKVLRDTVEQKFGYDDETDTDLDIEKFDEIYEAAWEGKLCFKAEDIVSIFKLFIIDKSAAGDMQGWQRDKIRQLTICALRQNDLEEGLISYAQGIKLLYDYTQQGQIYEEYPLFLDSEIEGCLGYLLNEYYKMDKLKPFFKEINNYSDEFKMKLREILTELIEDDYDKEFFDNISLFI